MASTTDGHGWSRISQEETERTESRNEGAKKWRQKDFNAEAQPYWPTESANVTEANEGNEEGQEIDSVSV